MTSPVPEPIEIQKQIGEAIAEVLRRNTASMTVKFVALAEVMDGDGHRGMWTFTSDDITAWDSMGLLQHAFAMEQADVIAARLNPDDDD